MPLRNCDHSISGDALHVMKSWNVHVNNTLKIQLTKLSLCNDWKHFGINFNLGHGIRVPREAFLSFEGSQVTLYIWEKIKSICPKHYSWHYSCFRRIYWLARRMIWLYWFLLFLCSNGISHITAPAKLSSSWEALSVICWDLCCSHCFQIFTVLEISLRRMYTFFRRICDGRKLIYLGTCSKALPLLQITFLLRW